MNTRQSSYSNVYINNNGNKYFDKRSMNIIKDENGAEIFGDVNDFPFYRKMTNKEFKAIANKTTPINLLEKLDDFLREPTKKITNTDDKKTKPRKPRKAKKAKKSSKTQKNNKDKNNKNNATRKQKNRSTKAFKNNKNKPKKNNNKEKRKTQKNKKLKT